MVTRKVSTVQAEARARSARAALGGAARRNVPSPGAKSELWQRLRAARAWAELSQREVGAELTVSRVTIAQWELTEPAARTSPSATRVFKFAQCTGVPVEWLLDDSMDHTKLDTYMQSRATGETPQLEVDAQLARKGELFWNALRYAAADKDGRLTNRFDVPVPIGGIEFKASLLDGKRLANFVTLTSPDWKPQIAREAAQVLMLEHGLGRKFVKGLLVYSELRGVNESQVSAFTKTLDVEVQFVNALPVAVKILTAGR